MRSLRPNRPSPSDAARRALTALGAALVAVLGFALAVLTTAGAQTGSTPSTPTGIPTAITLPMGACVPEQLPPGFKIKTTRSGDRVLMPPSMPGILKGLRPGAGSATGGSTTSPPASTPATTATTPGATTPGAAAPGATAPTTPTATATPTTTAAPVPAPAPAPAAVTAPTTAPATTTADDASRDKAALLLLIIAGAALVAFALAFAGARFWAWEPVWWSGRRHATAEAAWRFSNAWAEFRDWVRIGR